MITIILPTRNEGENISSVLDAILIQDFGQDQMEILVSDGMSTDQTRTIIKAYMFKYTNIRLIDNLGKIVPTGLNIAIRQAQGDYIIRIDGHTLIAADYVRNCIETLLRTGADNTGGCMSAVGLTNFGKAVAIATSTPFGVGNSRFHYSTAEEEVDSVYMGAWPKEVFKKIGLFDEELVRDQDDEFNYRLRANGGKIILNPNIKSIYSARSTPVSLWKQYFLYGYWKVRVLQKHPRQMSLRQFIPPAFVLALLSGVAIALLVPQNWLVLALVGGSYLIANLTASVITAVKKGWKHLPLLSVCFMILHVSYGSGFLIGLLKFWNRWSDKKGKLPKYESD
jgi:glycosyltransferase involved in cell wall biosynthesis